MLMDLLPRCMAPLVHLALLICLQNGRHSEKLLPNISLTQLYWINGLLHWPSWLAILDYTAH